MAEFMRARSDKQKALRIEEIKAAAKRQFDTHPYHEITLTTIADELSWSRANLYKYVSTKEEIFLELSCDECRAYFEALLAALPEGCGLGAKTIAEVWAGIANAHRSYFRLGEILSAIIETNVSIKRLIAFKRLYFAYRHALAERLHSILDIEQKWGEKLIDAIYFHGVGLAGSCVKSPTIDEVLRALNRGNDCADFRSEMADFLTMALAC